MPLITPVRPGPGPSAASANRPASPPANRPARRRSVAPRAVVGALTVATCVVLGAGVLPGVNGGQAVWSAARDLPAGTMLRAGDLVQVDVRLGDAAAVYVGGAEPVGWRLARPIARGELLASGSLAPDGSEPKMRSVTVPVARHHMPPDLERGSVVDVWMSASDATRKPGSGTSLVVADAVVESVDTGRGGLGAASGDVGVALVVPAARVVDVVAAARGGDLDLVIEPGGPTGGAS